MQPTRRVHGSLAGLVLVLGWLGAPAALQAQVTSNQAQVQLVAERFPEAITVSVSPSIVNFTLSSFAASDGDAPITITTDFVLDPSRLSPQFTLYAYFADPNAALVNGTSSIPSSSVLGSFLGNPAFPRLHLSVLCGGSCESVDLRQAEVPCTYASMPRVDFPGPYTGTLFIQWQVL
jgi:hypothetical protein